ncbi:MAG TPA: DUF2505 family protein [Kofleriaceae bacterium]|nr:DUF2505 family protein [Kofleriaceae bacterium]
MTPYHFEHVFRAPSTAAVFAAYFDAGHQIEQDRSVEIVEREVLELDDRDGVLRRVCRVVPRRQLPAIVKPLVNGQLHYIETVTWRRAHDAMEIDIRPSLLRGRIRISGTYRLERVGPHTIRRLYSGDVSVDIAVLAGRIERGIVAEFARSMPIAADCTQSWLDRHAEQSLSARA